ncbi:MAG: gluconolactonase [Chloroflexi bacterium]|nr:gluconolactonase [Chloroflexota bacterium]
MSDQITNITDTPAEKLAGGFRFTEGPLWHPDGHWLFVDIQKLQIHKMSISGQLETFRDPSFGTNGMTFDKQGNLVICESDNRQIMRRQADGSYTAIATHVGGKRLNRPNDIVGRSDGTLYFTDPGGRLSEEEKELDYSGVHIIAPSGAQSVGTTETEYPNGLAFSPDEKILYVAITRLDAGCLEEKEKHQMCEHQLIRAFDVAADGSLSNNRVFATMYSAEDGVPDGMKVDVEGNIYCTGSEGCWMFDASGKHLGIIKLPEIPANCAWGGPDNRTMLFTARTSVFSQRMKIPGTAIPTE